MSGNNVDNPKTFLYFDVVDEGIAEDNYNMRDYFINQVDVDNLDGMEAEVLRDLFMRPFQNAAPYAEMKMMNDLGDIVPAHIPNYKDLQGFNKAFYVFLQWEMEKLSAGASQDRVPESLRGIIDPKPVVQPINLVHVMNLQACKVCLATYTNAIHLAKLGVSSAVIGVKIAARMLNREKGPACVGRYDTTPSGLYYHEVIFMPMELPYGTDFDPVDEDIITVVWNVRGLSRLSFAINFIKLLMVHMPAVFILLETRISLHNLELIMEKIPGVYHCHLYGRQGLFGGVAIIWRTDEVIIQEPGPTNRGPSITNVILTGIRHPKSRRRLFLGESSNSSCVSR